MESNISRDHIAMEAMKILLEKSTKVYRWPIVSYVRALMGKDINSHMTIFIKPIVQQAYRIADAMIAEREK